MSRDARDARRIEPAVHDQLAADYAAAEERAVRLERELATCLRERDAARDAFLKCALAVGVVHLADGHPPHPGPVDDVVAAIRDLIKRAKPARRKAVRRGS